MEKQLPEGSGFSLDQKKKRGRKEGAMGAPITVHPIALEDFGCLSENSIAVAFEHQMTQIKTFFDEIVNKMERKLPL